MAEQALPSLRRGCVFGAQHDSSYEFWQSTEPPRWKLCVTFNAEPPDAQGDVYYFIATSKITYFRENPQLLSDKDVQRCESVIKAARLLDNRSKRRLALLN